MKKLIAFAICAIMVLSMIPVMTLTASAAVEGDWITRRDAGGYDEPPEGEDPSYTPAAGYHYTSDGFQTISPNFTSGSPFVTIRRRDADNLQAGTVTFTLRVDDFPYRGEDGQADEWITFAVWDQQEMKPGNCNYGNGWLCLIRGYGNGKAEVQSFWTTENDPETGAGGVFSFKGSTSVDVSTDSEGHELYTFEAFWNGSDYDMKVNGSTISGMSEVSGLMKKLSPNGDFWLSIIAQSGVADASAAFTITEFNGNKPVGDDSAEPEENINIPVDIMPADGVPANQPCFVWDANCTCHGSKLSTNNMTLVAQGDGSYHCVASDALCYVEAGIARTVSYKADDFPVIVILLKNYTGTTGQFWYSAGDVKSAMDSCQAGWDDDDYYGEDDEYTLAWCDLSDQWWDRINTVRLVFNGLTPDDEEYGEFDLMWWGCFRSVEEGQAYAHAFLNPNQGDESEAGDDTNAPDETQAPDETKALETTPVTEAVTDATTEAATKAENITNAATEAETKAAENTGCASVIGGAVAVLFASMAAAVALKKKH